MRYPQNQKAETHKQIVDAAAREFRARGLDGIGIAGLMAEVGLTRGGFYAHFKDRDALVAEAVQLAAEQSFCRLAEAAEAAPGREVEAMLDFYLSPEHREELGQGCLLPTIAAELSRQAPMVRGAFTDSLKFNMGKLVRFMPARDNKTRQAQAMAFISAMAGAVLLARAIYDPKLSDGLLASVRAQLLAVYGVARA
ncbi:MAG: TetR/AcrR family transcriptional regulator [Sterolibacterium sp.]